MSSHSCEQPLGYSLNGILYTNDPRHIIMCSDLRQKATPPVLQGWLLIAGSTVMYKHVLYN